MSDPVPALLQAAQDLRQGRNGSAADRLLALVERDLDDPVKARAHSLLAQALLELGDPESAKRAIRPALKIAKQQKDLEGLQQLRGLNGRIYARLAEDQQQANLRSSEGAVSERPLELLLSEAQSDAERAMACVRKSNQLQADDPEALELARRAHGFVRNQPAPVRERVLSLLSLARADSAQRQLWYGRARDIADRADEATLLAAVVRAARADGVHFEALVF